MKKLGKFEIVERVGQGAMGVVYKARDPLIGRLVALKTITTGLAEDPALLERFYHEAHSAGALQHPNIVTIYELGEEDHTPFIAMEYLTGQSLDKMIESHQALPLSQRIGYIAYVCRALAYAHKQGVVHRDIKPANVMVTSDGTVKVVDFGIARIAENSKSQTGLVIGTLGYMSPQQIEGGRADARSDVWAAGVLFYELLAYHRPFDGDNYGALMLNIMTQNMPPLSEAAPGTPPDVADVVDRMLRKEVDERFQSMEEVLIELEPVWRRTQRDEVLGLLESSREMLNAGDAPKAFELVRRVLQIDTANAPAKILLEQINAELRRTKTAPPSTAEKSPKDDETLMGAEISAIRPSGAPTPPPTSSSTQRTPVQSASVSDTASRLRAVTEARKPAAVPAPTVPSVPLPPPVQAAAPSWKQPVPIALLVLAVVFTAGGATYFYKVRQQGASTSETPVAAATPVSSSISHSDAPNAPSPASAPAPVSESAPANVLATNVEKQQRPATGSSTEANSRPPESAAKKSVDTNTQARATTAPVAQTPASQGGTGQGAGQAATPSVSPQDRTLVAANNPAPPPTAPAKAVEVPAAQPPAAAATPAAATPPPAKAVEAPVASALPPDNLDRQAITLLLEQLSAAFSHRSVDEVAQLWPKIPKEEKSDTKKAFDSVKSYSRKFTLQSLTPSGDGTLATAIGTYEGSYQISGGKETAQSGNFYVRFAKKNGRWYIDEARF